MAKVAPLDLSLLELTESDLALIHQWFNDPKAAGEYDGTPSISLEKIVKKVRTGQFSGMRVIHYRGERIGWTELNPFSESPASASLTVQISRPDFRGKGLGRQIHKMAIADFLKSHLQVQYIEAWTHQRNLAEQKILLSLDFVRHDGAGRNFVINGFEEPFISYELKVPIRHTPKS